MKTESEEKFDKIVKAFHLRLKPLGFKKKGNNFYLQKVGFGQHINFQKSPWRTKDDISFTINTGVFLPSFWSTHFDYNVGKPIPEFPSETECILRRRIGQLMNELDTWWDVNEKTNLDELTSLQLSLLDKVILPHFDFIKTLDNVKDLVNQQPYPGIPPTEKMVALGELGDNKNAQVEYDKLKHEFRYNKEWLDRADKYAKKYCLK
jgi:hypothetical protein